MKKILLGLMSFALLTTQVLAIDKSTPVYYSTEGKKVSGYLAKPSTSGKHPAVILIHEWWGLNDDLKAKADAFAEAGYIALAVDLYAGKSATKPEGARVLAGKVRDNMKEAFNNLNAAFSFLKSQSSVDKNRLGSVGWCFGGGWSYQIAKNNLGAKVSVIYYGRFNPADDLAKMRANILGHFAEKDRGIKVDNVKEFQAKLKTLSGDHEIYIYPNTGHGFANPNNSIHDKKATDLANQRTIKFLKEYL